MSDMITERMMRIGSKKNFMTVSQNNEVEQNQALVVLNEKTEGGIRIIELTLEPDKFDHLGSECRLSFEEFCEVINDAITEEEEDWHELRMKDQIHLVRDNIIEKTILKFAKEQYGIKREEFNGSDMNYMKRYDEKGSFLGEAVTITLTAVASMNVRVAK